MPHRWVEEARSRNSLRVAAGAMLAGAAVGTALLAPELLALWRGAPGNNVSAAAAAIPYRPAAPAGPPRPAPAVPPRRAWWAMDSTTQRARAALAERDLEEVFGSGPYRAAAPAVPPRPRPPRSTTAPPKLRRGDEQAGLLGAGGLWTYRGGVV